MDFEEILKELRVSLLNLVREQFGELKKDGEVAVDDFLTDAKEKLKKWTNLLAMNIITLEEYEWLLKSEKDLFTMQALYHAGVSKTKLEKFGGKIINTIIDVVVKLIF